MIKIIIWIIAAYGMSTIIVYGSIFEGLRTFLKKWGNSGGLFDFIGKFLSSLTSCMLCTSTWLGFFFSWYLGGITTIFGISQIPAIFFDGMFTAGAVWALNGIIEFFEENRIK